MSNREYVWLGDLPLAQIEAAGAIYYVHADHLNTPLKMTDATQVLVWERQQEPFGETVATSGTAASSLRFPGQFADPESGLNYNLMRDYDPTLGRYIEADPLGQLGGLNLYGYANQNPALYTDPYGENAVAVGGVMLIAGAFIAILNPTPDYLNKEIVIFPQRPNDDAKNVAEADNVCPAPIPEKATDNPWPGVGEWRGSDEIGGDRGAWYNPETKESLKPDLGHSPPIGPHWDYTDRQKRKWRVDSKTGKMAPK